MDKRRTILLLLSLLVVATGVAYGEVTEVWCRVVMYSGSYASSNAITKCKVNDNNPIADYGDASYEDRTQSWVAKYCCVTDLSRNVYVSAKHACVAEIDGILAHELMGCLTGPLYCYIGENGRECQYWGLYNNLCRYCREYEYFIHDVYLFDHFKADSPYDLDGDGDVDLRDVADYQNEYAYYRDLHVESRPIE